MTPGLAIFDTWLMMLTATAFLWLGTVSLHSKSGGADAVIALLGGVVGCALVALLGRRTHQRVAWALRLAIICCLAYFAWFQQRPWFALDDSALVRGSFRREFFLQRLEQLGIFLLFTMPFIALGIWRGKVQHGMDSPSAPRRQASSPMLLGLVALVLAVVTTARIVGPPRLGPTAWTLGGIMIAVLLVELARRVNRAEFPAVVAFAVVVVMTPVLLLWP
jgi:hypothetical protein